MLTMARNIIKEDPTSCSNQKSKSIKKEPKSEQKEKNWENTKNGGIWEQYYVGYKITGEKEKGNQ